MRVCVRVCVRACVRACVRVCVCVCLCECVCGEKGLRTRYGGKLGLPGTGLGREIQVTGHEKEERFPYFFSLTDAWNSNDETGVYGMQTTVELIDSDTIRQVRKNI